MSVLEYLTAACTWLCLFTGAFHSSAAAETPAPGSPSPVADQEAPQHASQLPPEVFAQQPLITDPKLSPLGSHVVGHMWQKDKGYLAVLRLGDKEIQPVNIDPDIPISRYRWLGDHRVLVSIPRWFSGVLAVYDIRTGEFSLLDYGKLYASDELVWVDPEGESFLLSAIKKGRSYPDVYRYDVSSAEFTRVQKSRDRVSAWFADEAGTVRVGLGLRKRRWKMIYRPFVEADWETLAKGRYDDEDALIEAAILLSGTDTGYVLTDEKGDRVSAYEYNFRTREYGEKLYEDNLHDVSSLLIDHREDRVLGIGLTTAHEETVWLDERFARLQEQINRTLPDRLNRIINLNERRSHFVIHSARPGFPGELFVFSPQKRTLERLAAVNEELEGTGLSPSSYERIKLATGWRWR